MVATTHFIGDPTDPLHRYSDTNMHRKCYEAWELRDEFTRRYRTKMNNPGWPPQTVQQIARTTEAPAIVFFSVRQMMRWPFGKPPKG
jgi:hypothetical protein